MMKTFHIIYGVPIVREAQHNEGLHAPLSQGLHGVFLQSMPVLEIDGQSLAARQRNEAYVQGWCSPDT